MKLLAVFLLVSSVVIQAFEPSCPSGWTQINNRCFLYVITEMTWADSEGHCQSMGANLASVHSTDEYNQVQDLIRKARGWDQILWLGGSDSQQWGTWLWSDGTRMSYTNWCPWQPDNLFFSQHCLQINYAGEKCWDDERCTDVKASVCAMRL